MLFDAIGIYGWSEKDQNTLLASILTGDPLLMIGRHGCAKTHVATKIAQSLNIKFLSYDASKAMFEDILGYPNIEKLKEGLTEYIASPITIWDKDYILIDEINRAVSELQSKWLEVIRSRKIMGYDTNVKWVWAAMNPITYTATNAMDEALIGRFAYFVYPPDVMDMCEKDRIKIAEHINGDDAPALNYWSKTQKMKTINTQSLENFGKLINKILKSASVHFETLANEMTSLSEFLAKFIVVLSKETKGAIDVDGRRLGFMYRNILAVRSVEIAKASLFPGIFDLPDICETAKSVILSSIPIELNEDSADKKKELQHMIELCFNLLDEYFKDTGGIASVNNIYKMLVSNDVMEKAAMVTSYDYNELVKSKIWKDILDTEAEISIFAYMMLSIEVNRPGTIPPEMLSVLSSKIDTGVYSVSNIRDLELEEMDYIDDLLKCIVDTTKLSTIISISVINRYLNKLQLNDELLDLSHVERIKQNINNHIDVARTKFGCEV